MKKAVIIIISALVVLIFATCVGGFLFYKSSLKPISSNDEVVTITIEPGTASKTVVDQLYDAKLIKNKYVGYIYLKLNGELALQAGTYELNRNMSLPELLGKIDKGEALEDSISVTFIEGKRIKNYAKVISENFSYTEEEILNKLNDKDYLNNLVEKYWFLTDEILNDNLYYALEGYLYPDTYRFNKDSSIEQIVDKMLNETGKVLNQYKDEIENSNYSVHQILTMASIVELEGGTSNDRAGVAGVFYNRLNGGWSLGSDVTTYYAVQVEMSERDLWQYEIEDVNDYNTRASAMAGKLPIGAICSPSKDSIIATINPTKHDYYFFVADKNGKTYFNVTNGEHEATIARLKKEGLWFVYK